MDLYSKAVVIDLYAGKFLCILTSKAAAPAQVIHSLIPPPLIAVEKISRFYLNKSARLICSAQSQFKRKLVEGKSIVAHVYNHELFM